MFRSRMHVGLKLSLQQVPTYVLLSTAVVGSVRARPDAGTMLDACCSQDARICDGQRI